MKHAVIVAHPNPDSFTLSMAKAYVEAAEGRGDTAVLRDLYRLGFDPCLKAGEIPSPAGFAPAPDVVAERARIGEAEVFAFVYPLWFNAPPAMMKGYVERVFGMGFGYGMGAGGNRPLLEGRRMVSITASGAPERWMKQTGAWQALKALFDDHIAAVCGLSVAAHLHFDSITPGVTAEAVAGCADEVRQAVAGL